jgi:uncharacterized membrane-anchored protein YjiN (DUF445 family)
LTAGPTPLIAEGDASWQQRARGLLRMKAAATSLLVLAAAVFLFARRMESTTDAAVWGYVRAAAEAGVVGGLADWFAVTALFRRPLGLPIPHTALIPTKKDQLGESLSTFVHSNFLSEGNVRDKVREVHPSAHIAAYLAQAGHRHRLVAEGAVVARALVEGIDDQQVQALVRNAVFSQLTASAWAPPAGRLLAAALDDNSHHGVVDGVLTALHRWVLENRERIAHVVADRGPVSQDGPIRWLHEQVGYKAADLLAQWVDQLRGSPEDPARQQLDAALHRIAAELQADPVMIERVEVWKSEVLRHPEAQRAVGALWPAAKDLILSALDDPDSDLRHRAGDYLADLGSRLAADADFAASVDDRIADAAGYLVQRYGADAVGLISETVQRWDAREASDRIENAVGRDLQFIRINGTVVGSLAGLTIYALSELIV